MSSEITFNGLRIYTLNQLMVVFQSIPNTLRVEPREFFISAKLKEDYPRGTEIGHLSLDLFRLEDLLANMNIPFTKVGRRSADSDITYVINSSRIDVKHSEKVTLELEKDQAEAVLDILFSETSAIADQLSHLLISVRKPNSRHELTFKEIDNLTKELNHLINTAQELNERLQG